MKDTQTKISEITVLAIENEDDLERCLKLTSINIPYFGEMMNVYLIHEIVQWLRFQAHNCSSDLCPFALALGHHAPNMFIDRFRFVVTCLLDGEKQTLEFVGISKDDCGSMLEWLKGNYPLIVEESKAMESESEASMNSPAVEERFQKFFKGLFGDNHGKDPVN